MNANVLHFVFFNNRITCPNELKSMIEPLIRKDFVVENFAVNYPSVHENDMFNQCTLDNRIPLAFLAWHPSLQFQQKSVSDS